MARFKTALCYAWAFLAGPIFLASLVANDSLSKRLVSVTGLSISPIFTGGKIVRSDDHGAYRTHFHRPFYRGLFCEGREGFVQIDWSPVTTLPAVVEEDFAAPQGRFHIRLDTRTGKVKLTDKSAEVLGVQHSIRFLGGRSVRVALKRNP